MKGTGTFKEYSWRDVMNLLYADMGLTTDEQQRTFSDMYFTNGFHPPQTLDPVIRIHKYDKSYEERMKDFEENEMWKR